MKHLYSKYFVFILPSSVLLFQHFLVHINNKTIFYTHEHAVSNWLRYQRLFYCNNC